MSLRGPVLITGHTGFKGAWLSLLLQQLGVPVIGYSLPPEKDSLYERANLTDAIPELYSDIRDQNSINSFLREYKPSCIIHMAAQPIVLESYKSPRETFEINVMGTVNILKAAFETSFVDAIVVVTTDKVYRNDNTSKSFVETDALEGKDPYSASKVATESAVVAWQQIHNISGGPKVISVRAGNVIGGGDWAKNRLLPDLVRAFVTGESLSLRNPQSTRPWQHVLDPLRGYIYALETILAGTKISSLNFGPFGKSLTVEEVVGIGAREWGANLKILQNTSSVANRPQSEAATLEINSELSASLLNWTPIWSQEDAVRSTISWWKNYFENSNFSFQKMNGDLEKVLTQINL